VTLEKTVEKAAIKYAVGKGVVGLKLDSKRGLPDRLFIGYKRIWFVEFKRPGQKARPKQRAVHRELARLGYPVSVVDTVSQFCSEFEIAFSDSPSA